jgi:hypothetical protein
MLRHSRKLNQQGKLHLAQHSFHVFMLLPQTHSFTLTFLLTFFLVFLFTFAITPSAPGTANIPLDTFALPFY